MPHVQYLPLFAFAIALTIVWWLANSRASQVAMDRPNERSLHGSPVPRSGGLAIHTGILLLCPWVFTGMPTIVWFAYAGLLIVSFVDDIRGLAVALRLATHLAAAAAFAVVVVAPAYGLFVAAVITLSTTWVINLYNFMDGSDGLAGGMTLFGFAFYGIAAWLAGNPDFAMINFCVSTAAAAFLMFNFHPARIFMGDVGSVPLGYLAGTVGMYGWMQQMWSWWFPLLVFSPFAVDASVTLLRRALRGARIWEAHKEHCYQKLVRMGWGHRRTALAEYGLMALCGIAALGGMSQSMALQITLLFMAVLMYILIIGLIDAAWRGFQARN